MSNRVFYLPQNPYLCIGTLLDNIFYPKMEPEGGCSVEEKGKILKILHDVELDAHIKNLEFVQDWSTTMSGGERQKLSFARLLFHEPTFAALDEATSAVSQEVQENLYSLLSKSSITYFSIAHRPEIRKYHQSELVLAGDGEGGWEIFEI